MDQAKNIYEQYLKEDFSELYSLAIEIDSQVFTNSHSVIVKARRYAELMASTILEFENQILTFEERNLSSMIKYLRINNIIDGQTYALFDKIRRSGNIAAHDTVNDEIGEALKVHRQVYLLTIWFIELYVDQTIKAPIYKTPAPKTSQNVANVDEIAEETLRKFLTKMASANMPQFVNHNQNTEVVTIPTQPEISDTGMEIVQEEFESTQVDSIQLTPEETIVQVPDTVMASANTAKNSACLIEELQKLKESSKEAVENLNGFSAFKKYMHVKRIVQNELEQLIVNARQMESGQLILVCGSVGDGKSHLLSYLSEKGELTGFSLYNDATESFDPEKDAIDTLNDELDEFSDEKIDTTTKKMIIAINLGVLSNFLDSKYKMRYTKLARFVREHKILDMEIKYYTFDHNSPFQFVNFSDYHLYYLTENGAKSDYISELMNKITNQNQENPFYQAYKNKCHGCVSGRTCPIKLNYELLANNTVSERITQKIIEVIVKDKLIISTRALLNFIYDILVHHQLAHYSENDLKNFTNEINSEQLIDYLLPTNLFSAPENSVILHSIATADPLNAIDEHLDELMVKINITDNITNLIDQYIDLQSYPVFKEIMIMFDEHKKNEEMLLKLITTFMRLNFLLPKLQTTFANEEYNEFLKYLYLFNNSTPQTVFKQTELITAVRQAIYDWNGKVKHGKMNILVGENQEKYICSQEIEITLVLEPTQEMPINTDELHKFLPNIVLDYSVAAVNADKVPLEIDYNLYSLLMRVLEGYRPNMTDKYNHIRFVDYVEQMSKRGNQNSELYITDKNVEFQSSYNLKVERFGTQNLFTFKKI